MIQLDGGIAHAVDVDSETAETVCSEGPADITDDEWADAPTPRCARCSRLLGELG